MFSEEFFQPSIRLLSSVKSFTTGSIVKSFIARKVVDIFGYFCQKVNREIAQHIMAPLLQQFFSCFDGIYRIRMNEKGETSVLRKYSPLLQSFDKPNSRKLAASRKRLISLNNSTKKNCEDEIDNELFAKPNDSNTPSLVNIDDILQNDVTESEYFADQFCHMYDTFSPSLAYHSYVLFCRVLGTHYLEKTLYNSELVWQLCTEHDEGLTIGSMLTKSDSSEETSSENSGKET